MLKVKEQTSIINEQGLSEALPSYREQLIYHGVVDITECLASHVRDAVVVDSLQLYRQHSERRDFIDENGSPRNLFNVPEVVIDAENDYLRNLYCSEEMLDMLQLITCEKVSLVPFIGERYIINGLGNHNDSQGWHWDDYAYAVVFMVKSAEKNCGGLLEYVPHIYWDRANPRIEQILKKEVIHQQWLPKGHVYLMRSDTTLHRVSAIQENEERISFVTAYRNEADLLKNIDHYSTLQLAGLV
jgi:L-lysine 4-chlorinase